jgi:hypothetical protein
MQIYLHLSPGWPCFPKEGKLSTPLLLGGLKLVLISGSRERKGDGMNPKINWAEIFPFSHGGVEEKCLLPHQGVKVLCVSRNGVFRVVERKQ